MPHRVSPPTGPQMETEVKMHKAPKLLLLGFSLLFLMGASRCTSIKYEDDIDFLNSAQANAFEWMVTIDGKVCKDLDGEIGACTKRIKSDHSPVLKHDSRPYAYQVQLKCGAGSGVEDFSQDVEANKSWSYKIESQKITATSFTCIGEVFPSDRDNKLSAKWQIRFLVYDVEYERRELLQSDQRGFLFGRFAKHSKACSKSGCKNFYKTTAVRFKNGIKAYSESEKLRFNYLGY